MNRWCLLLLVVSVGLSQEQDCSPFCQPVTGSGSTCDATTETCTNGCLPGYAGQKCTIQCCGNCNSCTISNDAQIAGVVCTECKDGYYLNAGVCYPCSQTCAQNTASSLPICKPSNGVCEFGCMEGYYGDMCESTCNVNCKDGLCDQTDGSCTNGCTLPLLTGAMCENACSAGCKRRECDIKGVCLSETCEPNLWGPSCSSPCPSKCVQPKNMVEAVCDRHNATCLLGCVNNTYWGSNCTDECSSNCVNKKCDFYNGNCLGGCIDNYKGPKCTEELKSDNTSTIIIASVVSGIVALIILAVVIYCCCKKCRS